MNELEILKDCNNGETITCFQHTTLFEVYESACSTPYVSAPSSPGRGPPIAGFFYSAPASPVHFMLSNSSSHSISTKVETSSASISSSFEFDFDFSGRYTVNGPAPAGSMSSADELFLNGQIRPMKLSSHLQRPQVLPPLIDLDETDGDDDDFEEERVMLVERERNFKLRNGSLRRRTRSMSPMRTKTFQWREDGNNEDESEIKSTQMKNKVSQNVGEIKQVEESSRSSPVGRSSKRWMFLKEFLYRSKSEGRTTSTGQKFWSSMSFSPVKDKKTATPAAKSTESPAASKKAMKRGLGLSAHELHYTANRAQAEEMRKKTFLPYSRGLLGCLRFNSKSYGAMNGFAARALNPVSSK